MKSKQIRMITHGAILAALYVALTYLQNWLLPGTTSAAIQFRASEALCIFALPLLPPDDQGPDAGGHRAGPARAEYDDPRVETALKDTALVTGPDGVTDYVIPEFRLTDFSAPLGRSYEIRFRILFPNAGPWFTEQ